MSYRRSVAAAVFSSSFAPPSRRRTRYGVDPPPSSSRGEAATTPLRRRGQRRPARLPGKRLSQRPEGEGPLPRGPGQRRHLLSRRAGREGRVRSRQGRRDGRRRGQAGRVRDGLPARGAQASSCSARHPHPTRNDPRFSWRDPAPGCPRRQGSAPRNLRRPLAASAVGPDEPAQPGGRCVWRLVLHRAGMGVRLRLGTARPAPGELQVGYVKTFVQLYYWDPDLRETLLWPGGSFAETY